MKKFLDESGLQHLWRQLSLKDYPNNETLVAVINAIDEEKADKNDIPTQVSQLENDSKFISEDKVKELFKSLNSDKALRFYCVEDVTVVTNDVPVTYPANSNVEVKFIDTDVFEIIPTSNNSILALNGFPGALGTYYPWLEGVKQFSNILFDMNDEAFYSKWSQGNQGAYQVQYAQYLNCIFWSDNPYISDVSKRTNYTLYNTSQLPLCYSSIPDNTFKAFYLAFNVNSDPNWGNQAYRDSFAKATWATQVFSYYGARTIGIFGHDDPDFNIVLPKDCRGLMYQSTAIENAGTFDAINTTNFGAKSGSWRDAFGQCSSLRNLFIKNLTVNLNVSWSPINYESIYFIISKAANTKQITISVSPYTYNLLGPSDFELATSKNIVIELITTNYVEDKRLGQIANKADKTYVDEAIANIPTESDVFIVTCFGESEMNHTFEEIAAAVNSGKAIYASYEGISFMPLSCVSRNDDSTIEFIEFNVIGSEISEDQFSYAWTEGITIFSDNTFYTKYCDLLTQRHPDIESSDGEKDIVANINRLIEKTNNIEEKKEKDLIVTYQKGSTYYATHSVEQILEAFNNGRTVYFQKDSELLNLLEINTSYATFYIVYLNMQNKLQQKVLALSGDSIILEQDDTYDFAVKSDLNRYYLKTEVDKKIADLVNSAPETLDTLGELATALQENEEVVNAINQAITDKADADIVLTKTEQTLTDEELTQVRSNLKFIGKDVAGQTFTVEGTEVTASVNAEIFGDYENNIAVGQWSIAEGSGTIAKGRASHAEGAMTKALADGTHTEGYQTKATGYWSHAEGEMTVVSSYASHAEGSYCTLPNGTKRYGTASGYASHIEGGGCYATGSCSHAEGLATTVSGAQSHAEGRYTIAAGGAQHVEGIANLEDAEGKYIHIAGNGTFENRSNAYTLDWDGNGWYAGDMEVSAIILRSSTPGSTKKFKLTIGDDGVLSTEELTN